jgi:general secretion pathway protein G
MKTRIAKVEYEKRESGNRTAMTASGRKRNRVDSAPFPPSRFPLSAFSQAAFTLIEIMVVVIVIGILAATIIPQFMGTTSDAKISSAKGHIAELESAVERFNVHMDRYPTMEEGLKALVEAPAGQEAKWRGPYIKQLRNDPWGNPYQYRAPGVHHTTSFDLWSRAEDAADGGEGQGTDIGNWEQATAPK